MTNREAFEQWCLGENYRISRFKDGDYTDLTDTWMWAAWQAATERAAGICDEHARMATCAVGTEWSMSCAAAIRGTE